MHILRSYSHFCFDSLKDNLCKTLLTASDIALCQSRPTLAKYTLKHQENPQQVVVKIAFRWLAEPSTLWMPIQRLMFLHMPYYK